MNSRIICFVVAVVMICSLFCSCDSGKDNSGKNSSTTEKIEFNSEKDIQMSVDGMWFNCDSGDYFSIVDGKLTKYEEADIEAWLNMLKYKSLSELQKMTFDDHYSVYLSKHCVDVTYDFKTAEILSVDKKISYLRLTDWSKGKNHLKNYCQKCEGGEFHSISSMQSSMKDDFENKKQEIIFDKKYPNISSATDVQYDKYGHLGDNFLITGIAEIDDYYNYGYRNTESKYFCFSVFPSKYDYTNRWYVYASRKDFPELFEKLKKGTVSIEVVAKLVYADTGASNMATLVEYFE